MLSRVRVIVVISISLSAHAIPSTAAVISPGRIEAQALAVQIRCYGCSCRGGPGYRSNKTFNCVGHKQLKSACGEPPTTNCACELQSCGFDSSKPRVKSAAELAKPVRTRQTKKDVSNHDSGPATEPDLNPKVEAAR